MKKGVEQKAKKVTNVVKTYCVIIKQWNTTSVRSQILVQWIDGWLLSIVLKIRFLVWLSTIITNTLFYLKNLKMKINLLGDNN